MLVYVFCIFFFSSRRRHTRLVRDWSSDVCSSDLTHSEHFWHFWVLAHPCTGPKSHWYLSEFFFKIFRKSKNVKITKNRRKWLKIGLQVSDVSAPYCTPTWPPMVSMVVLGCLHRFWTFLTFLSFVTPVHGTNISLVLERIFLQILSKIEKCPNYQKSSKMTKNLVTS